MYVSRPVRAIRDDPVPGESVRLLLTLADDPEGGRDAVEQTIREAVADHGGDGVEELAFGTLAVAVPHEAVADLCAIEGLQSIETDATLSLTLDGAGEDVEYED